MVRAHLETLLTEAEPHTRLPTERDLAAELDVSRPTVRQALAHLEVDGLVYRVQGAGTFVADPRITKSIELTSFSEDMRSRGLVPGSRMIVGQTLDAGPRVGPALGISPASDVIHLERVRTADGSPVCHEDVWLPGWLGAELVEEVMGASLYEALLRRGVSVVRAEQTIAATVLDPRTAELLDAPPHSAALHVTRTSYDVRGRAVEHAVTTYRGDRYDYSLTIHRTPRQETQR
ncbi:GntR family transcriptional regulator [Sanguibacter sp. A247]|uniref:GntR family transcriptional regulator n=1 Tax=unclassified Sanguibacter TaxID=2645534 RepID=UPI003FD8E2F3